MFASDIERRVLGHLPVWAADEEAFVQAELDGGAKESIRSYSVGELTARLLDDKSIPARSEDQVAAFLESLQEKDLAVETDGRWGMTKAGVLA
jgi:hypothetical protein